MKIRNGFVSNSSSSSFVLFGISFYSYSDESKELYDYIEKVLKPENIEEFRNIVGPDRDNIESYSELMEYLYGEIKSFKVESGFEGDPIVIGMSPYDFPEDKTVAETKKYIADKLKKMGFSDKVDWHKSCYYDG